MGLSLEMEANPAFFRPKKWIIERINPDSTVHVTDRDVVLDGEYLLQLQEAVRGHVTFTVRHDEKILSTKIVEVDLLAHHEWGGLGSMPELLAAFVTPNDPYIDDLLKNTSEILQKNDHSSGLEGYQSGSRKRVGIIVSAIWSAVKKLNLTYAEPPTSFEQQGQKIRTPQMIKKSGLVTCLDSCLLFASLMEQAGLNPIILFLKGHAFVGVWLQEEAFTTITVEERSSLRKRFDLKELLVFESTMITQQNATIGQAVKQAETYLQPKGDTNFAMAVDIRRARMHQVRPVVFASHEREELQDRAAVGSSGGMEELLDLQEAVAPIEHPVSETPDSRLDKWQRKLLDLSLRNKLLNCKAGASIINIICPDPGLLEDQLADGKRIHILPLPKLTDNLQGRDAALHQQQTGEDLIKSYSQEALEHNQVLVKMDSKQLESRMVGLYRRARNDLQDGGANTLFLALGFLLWQREKDRSRQFRAPLILVPVTLERKSVRSGIKMTLHEDEPRFNTTLLQMLRQDFSLSINGLDGELPSDDHGVDVAGIWDTIRRHVRDIDGFEVITDVAVGTFSFAKYLMWKDLVDRTDQLRKNPVVRHLLDTPRDPYPSGTGFARPERLDSEMAPGDLFTPLPADSSQLSAVVSSGQKKDFVLVGPPGTGKSQTIANMIAHNLAIGRQVLFVSEKSAALDVVYRRLRDKGLGDFCLELHSNKARKLDVLEQLRLSWQMRETLDNNSWKRKTERLGKLREGLNVYVQALHRPGRNGLTPYQAMGRQVLDKDVPKIDISFASVDLHTAQDLDKLREISRNIELYAKQLDGIHKMPFDFIHNSSWSPSWQEALLESVIQLKNHTLKMQLDLDALSQELGVSIDKSSFDQSPHWIQLYKALVDVYGLDVGWIFESTAPHLIGHTKNVLSTLTKFQNAQQKLSTSYSVDAYASINTGELSNLWESAKKSMWPGSFFKRRRVVNTLIQEGGTTGKPDPQSDLPILEQLGVLWQELENAKGDMQVVPFWKGIETDLKRANKEWKAATVLRDSLPILTRNTEQFIALQQSIRQLVTEGNALLCADGVLDKKGRSLESANVAFNQAIETLSSLAGSSWSLSDGDNIFDEIISRCDSLMANKNKLNQWCAWRKVRDGAIDAGLESLVEAMEEGYVAADAVLKTLEVNYCRWYSRAIMDSDPVLRNFISLQHEQKIKDFIALDESFTQLTSQYIRARQCAKIPDADSIKRGSEYGVLRRELEKKMRHKPVRQLFSEAPTPMRQLAPCLLMSPLSIAQYLPVETEPFDLVIFDEASQITVWDAVGALARGRQVVVAGDPKQLPPTSFFGRSDQGEEEDVDSVDDLESILDEMLGASIPTLNLAWHYRSEHESLIAFSNHRYYDGGLITFPSPVTEDRAVRLAAVPDGAYDRGGARTNRVEADAVVAEIVRRLNDPIFIAKNRTIGVVTFNSEQQRLIEDLLDIERSKDPGLETWFSDERLEPVFVKNLESVQGDERDLILFSIGYGPDKNGHMTMNFGPINKQGGERRLNVAITRARSELIVFATVRPDLIDLSRTQSLGVRDLKNFLKFAEIGPRSLDEVFHGAVGDFESPFEQAVARALKNKGWIVHPQVGVSAFRIDLAIVHPEKPGRYFVGVECDGATYHRSATARDRDKIRQAVLENLGWRIVRVWSTDWWVDTQGCIEKLHAQLLQHLEADNQYAEQQEKIRIESEIALKKQREENDNPQQQYNDPAEFHSEKEKRKLADVVIVTDNGAEREKCDGEFEIGLDGDQFLPFDVWDWQGEAMVFDPEQFHDPKYDPTLTHAIRRILEVEAPLRSDILIQRIARAHGFKRSGRKIRERVLFLANDEIHAHFTNEDVGEFIWHDEQHLKSLTKPRVPVQNSVSRIPEEIPLQELILLANLVNDVSNPIDKMARALGVSRITAKVRERLESAIEFASANQTDDLDKKKSRNEVPLLLD
ncbi:MAG: DUF3320 domain-containing protein [Magnetococcales bacterium]|nr:DUF3320 domain-containing protein [Magnetococcales bacterium]